jgi:hypothetical protein
MKKPEKIAGWKWVDLDERDLGVGKDPQITQITQISIEVGMMLGGKTNASAKKDRFISAYVAKAMSNLRILILFKLSRYSGCTFSIEPSSFLFLICAYLRPSAV